jgi:hypothetical protein
MKTIKSTNELMPFISIGMYNGQACDADRYFDSYTINGDQQEGYIKYNAEQFWDNWDYSKYKEEVQKRASDFLESEVFGRVMELIPDIKKMEVVGIWSPREYNFATDKLHIDLKVKNGLYKNLVKMIDTLPPEKTEKLAKYLKDNFTSHDGFLSYTDNNIRDLRESILAEEVRETSVFIFWVWLDAEFDKYYNIREFQFQWEEYFSEGLYYDNFIKQEFVDELDRNDEELKQACISFVQENYSGIEKPLTKEEMEKELIKRYEWEIEQDEVHEETIKQHVSDAIKAIENQTLKLNL